MLERIWCTAQLENPISIFLPDGFQGRVWLATAKDGSKIIGDERHWRLNIREVIRRRQHTMSIRERRVTEADFNHLGPTPGALQGDDYPLTSDANGYPELPACLDRRPIFLAAAA